MFLPNTSSTLIYLSYFSFYMYKNVLNFFTNFHIACARPQEQKTCIFDIFLNQTYIFLIFLNSVSSEDQTNRNKKSTSWWAFKWTLSPVELKDNLQPIPNSLHFKSAKMKFEFTFKISSHRMKHKNTENKIHVNRNEGFKFIFKCSSTLFTGKF